MHRPAEKARFLFAPGKGASDPGGPGRHFLGELKFFTFCPGDTSGDKVSHFLQATGPPTPAGHSAG